MTSSAAQPRPRIVRSVEHALTILRALVNGPLTLSSITRRVGLSKTSTYHLLRTLELHQFVDKGEDGRYALGWGAYEIGSAVARSIELSRAARPHLDALARDLGETALLGILDSDTVLYLDRSFSPQSLEMAADLGRRSPIHTNASGKLLLAYRSPEEIRSVLAAPLMARTTATITDADELHESLARIRQMQYATCWQEHDVALNSIAVPVVNRIGEVDAALAVVGTATRLTRRSIPRVLTILREEATNLSRALGFTGDMEAVEQA